jgi:hypothetical protein
MALRRVGCSGPRPGCLSTGCRAGACPAIPRPDRWRRCGWCVLLLFAARHAQRTRWQWGLNSTRLCVQSAAAAARWRGSCCRGSGGGAAAYACKWPAQCAGPSAVIHGGTAAAVGWSNPGMQQRVKSAVTFADQRYTCAWVNAVGEQQGRRDRDRGGQGQAPGPSGDGGRPPAVGRVGNPPMGPRAGQPGCAGHPAGWWCLCGARGFLCRW